MLDIHIGKLIEQRLKEVGMTKSEFARRINKARQNINDILQRKSIDTDLLLKISEALSYNFFEYFLQETNQLKEDQPNYEASSKKTPTQLRKNLKKYQTDLKRAQKEIEYLKRINSLLEERLKNNGKKSK